MKSIKPGRLFKIKRAYHLEGAVPHCAVPGQISWSRRVALFSRCRNGRRQSSGQSERVARLGVAAPNVVGSYGSKVTWGAPDYRLVLRAGQPLSQPRPVRLIRSLGAAPILSEAGHVASVDPATFRGRAVGRRDLDRHHRQPLRRGPSVRWGAKSSLPNQLTSGVPQHGRGRSVALPCGLIRRRS